MQRELHLFRIKIDWALSNPKKLPAPSIVAPSASIHVSCIDNPGVCEPSGKPFDDTDATAKFGQRDPTIAELSHLEVLPLAPEQGTAEATPLTVVAIFACSQSQSNALEQAPFQESFSVLCSWELKGPHQVGLHPSFEPLTSKNKTGGAGSKKVSTPKHYFLNCTSANRFRDKCTSNASPM